MNAKYNGLGFILGFCLLLPVMAVADGKGMKVDGIWSEQLPTGSQKDEAKGANGSANKKRDFNDRRRDDRGPRRTPVEDVDPIH